MYRAAQRLPKSPNAGFSDSDLCVRSAHHAHATSNNANAGAGSLRDAAAAFSSGETMDFDRSHTVCPSFRSDAQRCERCHGR